MILSLFAAFIHGDAATAPAGQRRVNGAAATRNIERVCFCIRVAMHRDQGDGTGVNMAAVAQPSERALEVNRARLSTTTA